MKCIRVGLLLATACLGSFASGASGQAFPANAEAQTQATAFRLTDTEFFSDQSGGVGLTAFLAEDVLAGSSTTSANLLTGRLNARAEVAGGVTDGYVATGGLGSIFEFLTFDTGGGPAEVSYEFQIDGEMVSAGPMSSATAFGLVTIFDVTGRTSFVETLDGVLVPVGGAPIVEDFVVELSTFGSSVANEPEYTVRDDEILRYVEDESGQPVGFDETAEGSFLVQPDRLYMIYLVLSVGAESGGGLSDATEADFSNTGRFAFTDLGGATLESSSGLFLSQVGSLVPGDYNASGQVEQGDLDLVLSNWGFDTDANGIPTGWTNDPPGGLIDQAELDGVLLNWGGTAAPNFTGLASVPEPAALGLLWVLGWRPRVEGRGSA